MRGVEIVDVERGDGFVDGGADDLGRRVLGFVFDLGGSGLEGLFPIADCGGDVRFQVIKSLFGIFDGFSGVSQNVGTLLGQ